MAWFRRSKDNIASDSVRKDTPGGMWVKCDSCGEMIHKNSLPQNLWVCSKCNFHFRIGSKEYFSLLLDHGSFKEYDRKVTSKDPLGFSDTKRYKDRLRDSIKKTGLNDAIRIGTGRIGGQEVVIACMDFGFIGGSMGSVVGEKIRRAVERALKLKSPLIIVSSSGGARMMEAAYSLMQMAKTSAQLARLSDAGMPYISIMTDPTTGGVTASFAMLGDINIAEPGALIGFAGPRVIKQTIGKDLPAGFQKSEFVLEKGFLDMIVHRKEMKETLSKLLSTFIQKK
jgi:acetyl-CoA carboxylase carboxyl transferase subunit beta